MVPAARLTLLVELGAVEVAVHHGGPAHGDLARLARGELGAGGVEDGDAHERSRPSARACAGLQGVERGEAHDLGLAVAGGTLSPGAVVDRDHRRPLGLAGKAPQGLEVEPAFGVELDDLVHGGRHDEGAGAVLLGDEPAQLLGVDPGCEDVGAPHQKGGEGGHERGHVEQWPAVEVHVVGAHSLDLGDQGSLEHQRPVREQGAVGAPGEGGGVHHEHRGPLVAVRAGIVLGPGGQEGLVAAGTLDVVADPQGLGPALVSRLAQGVADLRFLEEDDRRVAVADHEGEFGGTLAPVGGAEHRPELGRRQQALEETVAVLAQPQQPIARAHSCGGEGVGEPVHASVEGIEGEPLGAAHRAQRARPGVGVGAQDVGEGEVVECVLHSSTTRAAL